MALALVVGSCGDGPAADEDAVRAGAAQAGAAAPAVLHARVVRVVDGDTVQVRSADFDTVVRLIGVDTPETRHPSRPVECWGPEASALAARLMPAGAAVRLETDPTQDARDRYGRLLAHVYAGDGRGADSVNRALVAAGAGRVYVYRGRDFRHVGSFRTAQEQARRAERGLWGPPCRGRRDAPTANAEADRAAPPPRTTASRPATGCDPNYRGACVPPYPPDVDCADVGRPVTVVGDDPHRLDGDGNGTGCERFADGAR